jgi:Fe2+ or Zn2+ uptake regulation protein
MTDFFREQLKEKGLKVTPQRVAIYEAIVNLKTIQLPKM